MSTAIDVAIGMSFLYLLLALIVMSVQELIASWTSSRATDLYAAIEKMLQAERTKSLYSHPLIKNLRKEPKGVDMAGNPSYICSRTFALALVDVLQGERKASEATGAGGVLAGAEQLIDEIEVPEIRRALQALAADARRTADRLDDDVVVVTKAIETWFNDRMARASGWYKRKAQTIALLLAGLVVALSNADTIDVANTLWRDSAVREAVVERAKTFHGTHAALSPMGEGKYRPRDPEDPIRELEASPFPIGWSSRPASAREFALKVVGLLLSTLAVSLGSAFWFDMLGRVLQLRATGLRVSPATGNVNVDDK